MIEGVVAYRNRAGEPIPVLTWAQLFEDPQYRFLARETLPNGRYVVTIWGGMVSPVVPGLFSTGVFSSAPSEERRLGTLLHEDYWETEAQALAGHRTVAEQWSRP